MGYMYSLEELVKILEEAKEMSDLPIEDFVDWNGWIQMITSHIEAIKDKERNEKVEKEDENQDIL